jgi:predicted PurR-regulated permease PerM
METRPRPATLDRIRRTHEPSIEYQRIRLLAGLTLIAGIALLLGLPFALRAGAEFLLPVTAAMVIAIALVPLLEWLERRRVPSPIAAFLCLFFFLVIANAALASIVVPATEWFQALPERIPQIQANLAPVIDFYSNLQKFVDDTVQMLARGPVAAAQASAVQAPSSIMD